MTNQHPITPPPELVDKWHDQWLNAWVSARNIRANQWIANQSAQWGADQELEACLLQVGDGRRENLSQVIALRNARRPKLLSDKEQALAEVAGAVAGGNITPERGAIIRKALEAL